MFKKILIANRGEIAVRIIRCCRDLGIKSVAVFSDVDRDSLHVQLADEAYPIGPAPSKESYLHIPNILKAIRKSKADAVHPGYGFLSETPAFAHQLRKENITFIGPLPENIEQMGDKISSRHLMQEIGIPVIQGSDGPVPHLKEALEVAGKISYPVMIKASAGGGGKGMRVVYKKEEMESAFRAAQSEGENYFGDGRVYIERFIQDPKHIEVQVFGDQKGNAIHLYERECSIQRRYQKLLEETPCISLPEDVRKQMCEAAVRIVKAIKYEGAGTIEFIYDQKAKDFYFIEMNTRLQVEHAITEVATGIDLVREQLSVAAGNPLHFRQEEVQHKGHVIECRICAEDPITYAPSPGQIRYCRHPQGPFVRVDSCIYPGYTVPIFYDPMIAKLIVWGENRKEALQRASRALEEFFLTGIKSNIVLHKAILQHPIFRKGDYNTRFMDHHFHMTEPKLFRFISDHLFLISAAIKAYNDHKPKKFILEDIKKGNKWKQVQRKKSVDW